MLPDFRFHHIGIAVNNIDETAEIYLAAGYNKTDTVYDPLQHVHICFLNKDGMPTLELLAPEDDTSPVSKILHKNGVTPYHCCYEVDDIDDAIKRLRKIRYIIVSKPLPAVAIDGRRVCFLFNKVVGLIEIVEK